MTFLRYQTKKGRLYFFTSRTIAKRFIKNIKNDTAEYCGEETRLKSSLYFIRKGVIY